VADFDSFRRGRGRKIAWAMGVLLLALFVFVLPEPYSGPIRDVMRGTVLRPFLAIQARIAARARVGSAVRLKAQRDSLLAIVAAQSVLADENRRLRDGLGLSGRLLPSFIPAQVLRVGATGSESTFIVDVGWENGVAVGSPVLSPDGLVGVIWAVDRRQAQAVDWTRPEFRVSAMTSDGETFGIIEPKPGRYREEDLLVLTGAPFHSDIRVGRRIVTSGRGELVPRGIPIGTVAGIDDADTGWRKSYLIRPAARPEGLVHVFVGVRTQGQDVTDLFQPSLPTDTTRPVLAPPQDTTAEAAPDTSTSAVREPVDTRR
jgi:rod shape-determining protein MreC